MPCEPGPSSTLPLLHPRQMDHRLNGSSDIQFWTNIYSMEITSHECLSEVQSLLNCPSKINLARSFCGNEAQTFVDFLDQVLARSRLDRKFWQRSLRLLSKICETHKIIPSSYIIRQELLHVGQFRYRGGFADVSDGEYFGSIVAIKHLRMNEDDSNRIFKGLCREIISWKHLSHPNILPLLGVSVSADLHCFRILTEWMPDGNVMQYTRANPKANRLQLLSDVISGVTYLHDLRIVHGDLKGSNILVDTTGTARVADFGLMTMTELSTIVLSGTSVSSGGTFCWMSPELLDPGRFGSNGRQTREADCYALGMVIYEVLTGHRPFHHLRAYSPVAAVLRGERPEKPLDAKSLGFSDALWEMVELCWSESSLIRPTAQRLLDCLSPVSPTWVPPPVYPAVFADASRVTEPGSPGSSRMSLTSSRCKLWGLVSR